MDSNGDVTSKELHLKDLDSDFSFNGLFARIYCGDIVVVLSANGI